MPDVEQFLSENDISKLPDDVFFGDVVYEASGTCGPRRQHNFQLVLVLSGCAEVYIDGQRNELNRGEMAFLKPGHQEFFQFAKATRKHHRWCDFK